MELEHPDYKVINLVKGQHKTYIVGFSKNKLDIIRDPDGVDNFYLNYRVKHCGIVSLAKGSREIAKPLTQENEDCYPYAFLESELQSRLDGFKNKGQTALVTKAALEMVRSGNINNSYDDPKLSHTQNTHFHIAELKTPRGKSVKSQVSYDL